MSILPRVCDSTMQMILGSGICFGCTVVVEASTAGCATRPLGTFHKKLARPLQSTSLL